MRRTFHSHETLSPHVNPRLKTIVGLLGVALLLAAGMVLFLRYQIRKSFPAVAGTVTVLPLENPAEVLRDEYGVPRIEARSERDLMIALGYVHAQDRLWQMDVTRRAGQGRLSEIFGAPTVRFDRLLRTAGIRSAAERTLARMDPETRSRLEWYAEGVNAQIGDAKGRFPFEFDALRYTPEPWEPIHSVLIAKMMAWELNLSWWVDLTYGALVDRLGPDRVREIFPPYPGGLPSTAPWRAAHMDRPRAAVETSVMRIAHDYAAFLGAPAMSGGSNAWAVSPSRTAEGMAILANDTHLQMQNPARWYEVELRAPGWAVGGFSIPGVPGVVAGSNTDIAWGVTNLMADDADFYVLQLDSAGANSYFHDGVWKPLSLHEEEIVVRGDTVHTLVIRTSHHGPIVTDAAAFPKQGNLPFTAAMRWTGGGDADQIGAFHRIDQAADWAGFLEGVRQFPGPGQNFVYADREGNIGYAAGALIPVRGPAAVTPFLPLPGWDPAAEWRGFVPFDELPRAFNPAEGFIASANNPPAGDAYPHYISVLWEPSSRFLRLREVLGRQGSVTAEECRRLQNDTESPYARETLPYLMRVLAVRPPAEGLERTVMEYLRNWDFRFGKDDIATTVYHHLLVRLLRNIYADEMGDSLYHDFGLLVNVPLRTTAALLARDTSAWFDDVRTPEVEGRDDIIRRSFAEALQDLRRRGEDTRLWRWGEVHSVTLRHPFGMVKPLDRLFNIGPFPLSGASTALMSGEYGLHDPFAVTVAASFRSVIDFSQPAVTWRVLPSGQSGQVLHRHYGDQTRLWLNGAYRTVLRRPEGDPPSGWSRLVLEPEGPR